MRSQLHSFAFLALSLLGGSLAQDAAQGSNCRCFPGDACWPSDADWSTFNSTVGGRLIKTVPIASVCHGETYDEAACTALRAVWMDPLTQ